VQDQPVREHGPVLAGEQRHQILFDLHRILLPGETEPQGHPPDVGVDDHPFLHAEGVAEDHVRGLAADPGQSEQAFHRLRHPAVECLDQPRAAPEDRPGLVAEEAGRLDASLEFLLAECEVILRRAARAEQLGCDHVDPNIGALGREHRGDVELQRVGVVERAPGIGVGVGEPTSDPGG